MLRLFSVLVAHSLGCEWVRHEQASPGLRIKLIFALPYSNQSHSAALLREVSEPGSPSFRQYKPPREIAELVRPPAATRLLVESLLQRWNVSFSWSSWGHYAFVNLTVSAAEQMLLTQCHFYQYECDGAVLGTTIKTLHESFPGFELWPHVAYIGGNTLFPPVRRRKAIKDVKAMSEPRASGHLEASIADPVSFFAGDKQAGFSINIVCPDGSFLKGSFTCPDGRSTFDVMVVRYAMGSEQQRSLEVKSQNCGSTKTSNMMCTFVQPLKSNFVRYVFGFDFLFAGGLNFTYNMQHYIVGDSSKDSNYLKSFYQVPDGTQSLGDRNFQAVGSLTLSADGNTGFYSPSDLLSLYDDFGVPRANAGLVSMVGENNPKQPDVETNLDIQWISAMAIGVRSAVWHSNTVDSFESIISQIQQLALTNQSHPLVLSLSYGGPERGYHTDMLTHMEEGLQSLGSLGVTVVVASGDSGAFWDDMCSSFEPEYPASSQFVTSVGATQMVAQNVSGRCQVAESVCSLMYGASITSGGGFSLALPRPLWQVEAVSNYLQGGGVPQQAFKRGYPDVALFGHNFKMIFDGKRQQVDGTSASAPALAGMISLINGQLLARGLGPVGFLNPALYKAFKDDPSIFRDIVKGHNGCTRDECCESPGYGAVPGWDPASGLGSPLFQKLALALGAPITGIVTPLNFPTEVDCTEPLIWPNPEDVWKKKTMWVIIGVSISVAFLGAVTITLCWYRKRHASRVHMEHLRQGLNPLPGNIEIPTGSLQ